MPKPKGAVDYRRVRGVAWEPTADQLAAYAEVIRGQRTGIPLSHVAESRGIARQTLHEHVQKIAAWLRPQLMEEIRHIRFQHADHLLHIFAEAMQAWERSKEDAVEQSDTTGGAGGDTTTVKRRKQAGNPAFLAEARAALESIRKMWGADEPQRFEMNFGGEVRVAGIPRDEAIRQQIARMQAAIAPQEN